MKNYLVKSLFKVNDTDWKVHDRSHEKNLYDQYVELHRISLASYKSMIDGDWEYKFIGGNVDNINQAFEKTFWAIHDLWHKEPCNIFYTDPDTIALKKIAPWNQYSNFTMFNYTDPKSFNKPNQWNCKFENFFNAGVRYFPASMSADIWKLGAEMARGWNYETYDTEQIILNNMLWSQPVKLAEMLDPSMEYQAFYPDVEMCNQWNNTNIHNATIVHFHSSRDVASRVDRMQKLAKQLNFI